MRFIISFQAFGRTLIIGHGEKKRCHFISMVTVILCKLLQLGISKEELQNCIRIAEDIVNEEKE